MIRHLSANIILIGFFGNFSAGDFIFGVFRLQNSKCSSPILGFFEDFNWGICGLKNFKISNSHFITIVFFTEFKIL